MEIQMEILENTLLTRLAHMSHSTLLVTLCADILGKKKKKAHFLQCTLMHV